MFEIGHIPQMRKHTAHNVDNRVRTTLALSSVLLKKLPAEKVWTKRQIPPATWNIIYGEYKESLRLKSEGKRS